jgi:hypothetical protein
MDQIDSGKAVNMDAKEKKYLKAIEQVIENFGTIQRNFVLDKTGIRAIIKFIEDLEGRRPFFELDDPVVQKGKTAAKKVIDELTVQLDLLKEMEPPQPWTQFHQTLIESIKFQLEGYKEMSQVFEDSNMNHILEGQEMVNRGMKILEGGTKKEE